jgi:hypothetical protein
MFRPEEVIFAPTAQCNLHCAHCRVTRIPDVLDEDAAVAFLESCQSAGIDRVGFSGGEPFLRPAFLCALSKAAVDLGMIFDRLMTNGVWFQDEASLRETLGRLSGAGFDGTVGVSVDSWHEQDPERLACFFRSVYEIWGRRDCIEILSVRSDDEGPCNEKLARLAREFEGAILAEGGEPLAIADSRQSVKRSPEEDAPESLFIDIHRFPYSASAAEDAWRDDEWFEDDFCAGPGNVLYVHPNGDVAACCGFANENPELLIGNIALDGYEDVMRRAAASPHIADCYDRGLGAVRAGLEASGMSFPGKTRDICFFCDWLCARRRTGHA